MNSVKDFEAKEVLKYFFEPRSVAIIGVSRHEGKPGYHVLENFVVNKEKGVFKGEIYPVNPKGGEILGLKVYRNVLEIPNEIEHAVIIVPAAIVPKVLEECGKKGVKAVTIISSGFSEIGNVELEEEVKRRAKKYRVRIIGPNGLGVFSPYTGVDTIFLPPFKKNGYGKELLSTPRPQKGYIALISQSGAFGISALDYTAGIGIGISKFISYGNRIDIDEAPIIKYLGDDPSTRVITIYVEGIRRGREFMEACKEVTLKKPIIVLKAGRTSAGTRAAASHTASLAGSIQIYNAAFKQSGCIAADTLEAIFDMAKALVFQPPAKGRNVAILTDGGGFGVISADMCEYLGLNVSTFSGKLQQKFEELKRKGELPEFAATRNPIDVTGIATSEMYEISAELALSSDEVDSLVVIALHHPATLHDDVADRIARVAEKYRKPVVAVDVGETDYARYLRRRFEELHIPAYPSPERAVKAIKALTEYGEYLKKRGVLEEYLKRWKPLSSLKRNNISIS